MMVKNQKEEEKLRKSFKETRSRKEKPQLRLLSYAAMSVVVTH